MKEDGDLYKCFSEEMNIVYEIKHFCDYTYHVFSMEDVWGERVVYYFDKDQKLITDVTKALKCEDEIFRK